MLELEACATVALVGASHTISEKYLRFQSVTSPRAAPGPLDFPTSTILMARKSLLRLPPLPLGDLWN